MNIIRYKELLKIYHDIIGQPNWDHEKLKLIAEEMGNIVVSKHPNKDKAKIETKNNEAAVYPLMLEWYKHRIE